MELFSHWMKSHARGTLDGEVTDALREVVQEVSDLGKKGSVLIEVVVEPAGSSKRTVAIGGKVTKKSPKPDAELSVYYPDERGELFRDDPFQARLHADAEVTDPAQEAQE